MTVRIILACANCGNTTFAYKDGDFECLACGEVNEVEDLTSKVVEVHELSEIGLMEKSDLIQAKNTSNVYKVSDDEWEDIMGSEQLRSFALDQMVEKINTSDDEEIEEDIDSYVTDKYKDKVREIFKLFPNNEQVLGQLTDELAIEILKLRYFDVEKLHIK